MFDARLSPHAPIVMDMTRQTETRWPTADQDVDTAWCPTCRTMREVMDTYATDTGDGRPVFEEYIARPLSCGHDAGDGGAQPSRSRFAPDPGLVARVAELQRPAPGRSDG